MNTKYLALGLALAGAVGVGIWWAVSPQQGPETPTPITTAMHSGADTQAAKAADAVVVPELSPKAQSGEVAFLARCSACHGVNAAGSENGPPLIHSLYRPGHHPDESFANAPRQGVRAHHWRFGDMPPLASVLSNAEIASIVAYVREMQRANGVQ